MSEWGQSRRLTVRRLLSVYPDKQTCSESVGMSQSCQPCGHWPFRTCGSDV